MQLSGNNLSSNNFHQLLFDYRELLFSKAEHLWKSKIYYELVIGYEIEFFIQKLYEDKLYPANKSENIIEYFVEVKNIAAKENIQISDFSKEEGNMQYEVSLIHNTKIAQNIKNLIRLKEIINETARSYDFYINFDPKPYGNDDLGNGLHIHISLRDKNGSNIFSKEFEQYNLLKHNFINQHNNRDKYNILEGKSYKRDRWYKWSQWNNWNRLSKSDSNKNKEHNFYFQNLIAAMLLLSPEMLYAACKEEQEYLRFSPKFHLSKAESRKRSNYTNAPTHIAWGENNRTVLIRIPDAYHDMDNIHLEFRLFSSNIDPYIAGFLIIITCFYGIYNTIKLEDREIYGNAFDPQYNLKSLPKSADEAKQIFEKSGIIKSYIENFLSDTII